MWTRNLKYFSFPFFFCFQAIYGGMVVGHRGLMSVGMGIHAYDKYARAWAYRCMGLGSFRILNQMHGCNGLGWHSSKLVPYIQVVVLEQTWPPIPIPNLTIQIKQKHTDKTPSRSNHSTRMESQHPHSHHHRSKRHLTYNKHIPRKKSRHPRIDNQKPMESNALNSHQISCLSCLKQTNFR